MKKSTKKYTFSAIQPAQKFGDTQIERFFALTTTGELVLIEGPFEEAYNYSVTKIIILD